MDIKRYDIEIEYGFCDESWLDVSEDKDGEYVKYSDHLQVVKELEDKIESMKNCINCGMDNECPMEIDGDYTGCYNWQPKEK